MSGATIEARRADVVILGGGLAGLLLARHLLLETDKRVTLVERRKELPQRRQKVGESTVQLAGYYLAKVLDLEEHLFHQHFMKYNLRFYTKTAGLDNNRLEDYSQSYIRNFSNIASFQLDRNVFEGELLRLNREHPRFELVTGISRLEVDLATGGRAHEVAFKADGTSHRLLSDWVVDATGRSRFLAKRKELRKPNSIRHGAFFWWVDGLVDIEKLTDLSPREVRLKKDRRQLGHLPAWLATNHFTDEGLWFWVIPLRGKTSLGLVYDTDVVSHDDVFSVEKATRWVCERFPLFARDLPQREVLDFGGLRDFSHDCELTLSPDRWALAGEAGRFSDPLYSPGSDLIAIHNTLIVDAIQAAPAELPAKCATHEQLMRNAYAAYERSYSVSYDALGDAETFSMKYTWELAVYFGFYVFPFINDLLTQRRFTPAFLRAFSRLGPINAGLHRLLSGYFQWKKGRPAAGAPVLFDFTRIAALARAADTFFEVGVSVDEARAVLAEQLRHLEELARFLAAWVASVVLGEPEALTRRDFVESIDLRKLDFDPHDMRARFDATTAGGEEFEWSFDPGVLEEYRTALPMAASASGDGAGREATP